MATVVITLTDGEDNDVKVTAEFDPSPETSEDGMVIAETGAQAAAILALNVLRGS